MLGVAAPRGGWRRAQWPCRAGHLAFPAVI